MRGARGFCASKTSGSTSLRVRDSIAQGKSGEMRAEGAGAYWIRRLEGRPSSAKRNEKISLN